MKFYVGLVLSVVMASAAQAEPKKLECKNTGHINSWAGDHSAYNHKMCAKYGSSEQVGLSDWCADAKQSDAEVERCLATGQDYSHTHYRIFDSEHLFNGTGKSWVKPCWKEDTLHEVVEITSTDSVVSFKGESGSLFNVDRKTLKAGWGDNRDYTCTLSDLDVSDNKL